MTCRPVGLALAVVTLLHVPAPDAAQSIATARLVAARTALRGAQPDSAEALLRQALDSVSGPTRGDRVEAWLLIGVARYYAGNDSGVVAAFREALALDPQVAAPRLGEYDPSLVTLLEAQRRSAADPLARAGQVDTVEAQVCVPSCPKGISPPRLRTFPVLDWNSGEIDPSMAPRDARLVAHFLVDTLGRVDTLSIHVIANNFPVGSFFEHYVSAYLTALAGARYDPARAGKRAVPVVMENVLRFEVRRGWRVNGIPVGHHF
jgi:hypothetical protein